MGILSTKLTHVLLQLSILISISVCCYAHTDGAYMRNADDGFTNRISWMSEIHDDVMLSELALPGTHDSATFNNNVLEDIVTTQVLTFDEQFKYGIRVFDMRVRHISNAFVLHHGLVYVNLNFDDFLKSVERFLRNNPSETVLFRLKEEHEPDNNTRSLGDTLKDYLGKYKHVYLNTKDRNTPLGSARGKFIILSDNKEFHGFGMDYNSCDIQDDYNLKTNWDLYSKWEKIKSHLEKAINGDKNTMYINYLSGSGGSFPYFVASGHSSRGTSAPRLATGLTTPLFKNSYPDFPRISCLIGICTIAFEGTNILTKDKIIEYNSNEKMFKRTIGVIIADFPGDLLIDTIIQNNKFLEK
ncbi:hypothetical protein J6590_047181 [Homalodisca vitripennis]|nr:hypothetical protein J6590_047181 [Homalodisca vitripennis]